MSTIRRERPTVQREESAIPIDLDPAPAREAGEVERAGLDRAERFEAVPEPEPPAERHAIGTCRICSVGQVVLVQHAHSWRGPRDIRAYCLFCNRDLDPHEVDLL